MNNFNPKAKQVSTPSQRGFIPDWMNSSNQWNRYEISYKLQKLERRRRSWDKTLSQAAMVKENIPDTLEGGHLVTLSAGSLSSH